MIGRSPEVTLTEPAPRELLRTGGLAFLVMSVAVTLYLGVSFVTGERLPFAHDVALSDIWHQNLPFRAFYDEELAAGRLPHWCPTLGTGIPLLAEGQTGALYPPNLALHLLLPLALAFNLSIFLSLVLAGTFAAMFSRQVGAGRGPAIVAAIVYGLSGFLIVHLKHVNFLAAAAWAPLILLLIERLVAGGGWRVRVLLAGTVAVMLTAGAPQIAYYTLLLGTLYALVPALTRRGWWNRFRPFVTWLGLAGIGFLLAAPQLLPTLEMKGVGLRREGMSIGEATRWGIAPKHLVAFVNPYAFGDVAQLTEKPAIDADTGRPFRHPATGEPLSELTGFTEVDTIFFWEMVAYVGILPLLLAAAGIGFGLRSRVVWTATAALALAVVLALGQNGGLYLLLFRVLPGFDFFRMPSRFLLFADLMIAVLAARGLTGLLARFEGRRLVVTAISSAAAGIVFLDLWLVLGAHNVTVDADEWLAPPATARAMWERERVAGRTDPFRILTADPARLLHTNAYHRARGWKGDLAPYEPARLTMDANLPMLHGLTAANVYSPLPIRWMHDVGKNLSVPPDPDDGHPRGVNLRQASLVGVRYFLDPYWVAPDGLPRLAEFPGDVLYHQDLVLPTGPAKAIRLFENPWALPRAWLVPQARFVADGPRDARVPSAAMHELNSSRFDPRREVIVTEDGPVELPAPAGRVARILRPVTILEYSPGTIRIRTDETVDAWLVLSDTWYPGWEATVDGTETRIYRANIAGRTVQIPAGRHDVVLRFVPVRFRQGLLLAGVGVLLLLLLSLGRLIVRPRRAEG